MIISTEKNGILNLDKVVVVGKGYRINEKKFFISFVFENGMTNTWTFDDEKNMETVYGAISAYLTATNIPIL